MDEVAVMMQHMIVPIDGSAHSWQAAETAVSLARRCNGRVDVVEVVFETREIDAARLRLDGGIGRLGASDIAIQPIVSLAADGVASAIADLVEGEPDSVLTMASHGRGRSAALLGSIAEELLQRVFGPIVLVGPRATVSEFDGPIVVTVDGSELSEAALPLAAAWGIELGATPWVVGVVEPAAGVPDDVGESAYPSRLARELARNSAHRVEHEILHGRHVDHTVADFAASIDASLIVASTHGRTGLERFVVGSTATGFVRHARCPVLLVRPPHLASVPDAAESTALAAD
jgi:nucleotide-binding universal stress UspA family protein